MTCIGRAGFGFSISEAIRTIWACRGFDVLILAEFQLKHAVVAKIAARVAGATLVIDSFVGRHETVIEDWHRAGRLSLRSAVCKIIDWTAFRTADLVLIDTKVRASALEARYRTSTNAQKIWSLPVGAPDWAGEISPRLPSRASLKMLYYGGYTPLQGVEFVLKGISDMSGRVPIELTLIGDGPRKSEVLSLLPKESQMFLVKTMGAVSTAELVRQIELTEVVLGVFGTSEKAAGVIANKVWQGLAAGRTVITRRSDALLEISGIAGEKLQQIREADPGAVAVAVLDIWEGAQPTSQMSSASKLEDYVNSQFAIFADALVATVQRATKRETHTRQLGQ